MAVPAYGTGVQLFPNQRSGSIRVPFRHAGSPPHGGRNAPRAGRPVAVHSCFCPLEGARRAFRKAFRLDSERGAMTRCVQPERRRRTGSDLTFSRLSMGVHSISVWASARARRPGQGGVQQPSRAGVGSQRMKGGAARGIPVQAAVVVACDHAFQSERENQ